ncbi:MAG: hypothetical protein ACKPKO_14475 [Candidatus Fonsibacter sp.]
MYAIQKNTLQHVVPKETGAAEEQVDRVYQIRHSTCPKAGRLKGNLRGTMYVQMTKLTVLLQPYSIFQELGTLGEYPVFMA